VYLLVSIIYYDFRENGAGSRQARDQYDQGMILWLAGERTPCSNFSGVRKIFFLFPVPILAVDDNVYVLSLLDRPSLRAGPTVSTQ
jgi:hypothetical protein